MKLTKQQRHMAYKIMLAEIKNVNNCLCGVYENVTGECPYTKKMFNPGAVLVKEKWLHGFEYYLPELWAKRTTDSWTESWFYGENNRGNRINILKKCIEETYYQW